jgi:uncharacterized protein (TIGR00290 family)
MMPPQRVLLAWSSGKDSAWALHLLRQQPDIEVVALLTTFHEDAGAVAMHRVPRPLVELQARAARLPLWPVNLPWPCPNDVYEARMSEACARARAENVTAVAFGDLFLEDIRAYRERALAPTGLEPLFPLWGLDTRELAHDMIRAGQQATLACIDPNRLPTSFCGREFDDGLLLELPPTVDPCGENGEFHTFVHHAPAFSQPIPFQKLEAVELDGFVYLPLSPL